MNRQDEDKVFDESEVWANEKECEQLMARNRQLQIEICHAREVIQHQEQAMLWYLQSPRIQSMAAVLFAAKLIETYIFVCKFL